MKPRKLFLSLIFASLGLTACELGGNKPVITPINPGGSTETPTNPVQTPPDDEDDNNFVIKPSAERMALIELYKPESLRGIDSLPQLMFDSYNAHMNSIEKNRTFDSNYFYTSNIDQYYIDLDEDGDGENEVYGYPMSEMSSYSFSNYTYFEFDTRNSFFADKKLGGGRISAVILNENIFGENVLILKKGYNYFACCATSGSNNVYLYGAYKHINRFHILKDLKDKTKIEVTFDKTFGTHKTVLSININGDVFNAIEESVIVKKDSYSIVPEEEINYLNEYYVQNSGAPSDFFRYRLKEYSGESGFVYGYESDPSLGNPNRKAKYYIRNTNDLDFTRYINLLESCGFIPSYGFTYSAYHDDIVGLSKAYDKDYDIYVILTYDAYSIEVYLVPYINTYTATVYTEFPETINGLNFSYCHQFFGTNAKFYKKTIEDFECVFIYDSTETEFNAFLEALVSIGLVPSEESRYIFTVESDSEIFTINADNLDIVPYRYVTVHRSAKN